MNVTAIVERISDDRYRAVITQPFLIESEGDTFDDAVSRIRELATNRLTTVQFVQINIPHHDLPHPWARWAGIWKNNPDFDQFLANIAECRRNADAGESS